MGDIGDLKSPGRNAVRVQFPPPVPKTSLNNERSFFITVPDACLETNTFTDLGEFSPRTE